nr:MAG TPA: hypothetical protein [Caudoviricetes sp.]
MHTSILPVERRYTLFECLNVKLYCRQEKACRRVLQAFITYAVVCGRSMRPRKRCRRASAASRRLFIRPSGRGCLRLSLRSFELSAPLPVRRDLLHLVSRSGGQVRRSGQAVRGQQVSRSGVPSKGGSSLPSALFVSARPPKSRLPKSRQGESRERVVSQSRQSRKTGRKS